VFDADGETATFIDDRGEALSSERALLVLVTLVCRARHGARVAVPVSVSREAERIAAAHGATITWTKLSAAHLMEVAGQGGIEFAASQEGGFIWPEVLPAYDAVATLLHLLGLLVTADEKLSEISAQIPPSFIAHEEVPTPWDTKGAVMREIVERSKGEELVLVDGVKIIRPEGWVLVLPDPELPSTHVWAEGDTDREARRLVAVQAGRIAEIAK
jgi:mannose-1-phosphate guanylyltransferase/phosphomannomutase